MKKQREYFLMNQDEKVMLFTSAKNEYGEVLLEEQDDFGLPLPPGYPEFYYTPASAEAQEAHPKTSAAGRM